ncbi:uncharacterized protein EI97DRAFT_490013 [Westerdykella ornata]|uniref:Alpha-galactosidase n=1 Tax=Westerdykella ornata TaxID=318751 RepID=A0A6A6JJ55_WESOR|nr:uncharacterized protein EI97DRAFT_490013 [Westerdykella ornata]KAF2276631.1 hypothetical protein EI97DRAFT_490013 [Westerdykella ornata]
MSSLLTVLTTFAALLTPSLSSLTVSPRPPMGFNNWARFMCNLNESLFVETANAMLKNGLHAAGYTAINLDDCWPLQSRSHSGELQWNSTLFPHGLPWLGDYLHARNFTFGIYTNAGKMTCGWYPSSQDNEETDAKTFARWGVDYVKVDGCHIELQNGRNYYQEFEYRYKLWHAVLSKLDRPMVFSQSAPAYFSPNFPSLDHPEKPQNDNYTDWYKTMQYIYRTGELARHSDDIKVWSTNPDNSFMPGGHWESILNNYDKQIRLSRFQQAAGCGFYNDPDFLIADFPDLTPEEKKSHFSLWSAFSAPLIISAWIPGMSDEEVAYLKNEEVIAVDQDALCQQATVVSQDAVFEVLSKSLENGDRLLAVLNKGEVEKSTVVPLKRLGIEPEGTYKVKDLWSKRTRTVETSVEVRLKRHETGIYRISVDKQTEVAPTGQIFNTFSMRCLTAHKRGARFEECKGGDEQVWLVRKKGIVRPLSATNQCLFLGGDDAVVVEKCDGRRTYHQWSYGVDGNLVSRYNGLCLEEGEGGEAVLRKCGVALNSQVLALPGGVELER